jgi:cytochrome c oxidase assembly factor CtaG
MSPTWKDLLTLWAFWPQIILILVGLGVVYGLGWRRLRERGAHQLANGWRLASFIIGLLTLGLAMLSAIEVLQDLLFSLHMVQHLLIMMVGAPLLLLADPYPFLVWGLPTNARRGMVWLMGRGSRFRRIFRRVATPWVIWVLYVGSTWIWHIPAAYDAALRYEVLHVMEHLTYFLTALLFWWHITGSSPRLYGRLGYGFRLGYALAALVQNELLGIIIAFSGEPLFAYYTTVPRLWGISVMEDQMLGGALMWVPGGMMYALTAVILLARWLQQEEERAAREATAHIEGSNDTM